MYEKSYFKGDNDPPPCRKVGKEYKRILKRKKEILGLWEEAQESYFSSNKTEKVGGNIYILALTWQIQGHGKQEHEQKSGRWQL